MHPNNCRVACDAESCNCTPTRQSLEASTIGLVERLSDEADLCRSEGADDIARLLDEASCALDYYSAAMEKRTPKWVPSRILLAADVRGDFPLGHNSVALAGAHECDSNANGAVSVLASDGSRLGIKPAEFRAIAWRRNSHAVGSYA